MERRRPRLDPRTGIAAILFVAIIGLAIWYLARPEPLLVQGEAESTRIKSPTPTRRLEWELNRATRLTNGRRLPPDDLESRRKPGRIGQAMEEARAIIRANLEHYEALLKLELDEDKRRRIENLIRKATAKLAASAKSASDENSSQDR
jgi:hypothetical protein